MPIVCSNAYKKITRNPCGRVAPASVHECSSVYERGGYGRVGGEEGGLSRVTELHPCPR